MMKKHTSPPLLIGLTGGIATGKSSVAALVRKAHFPVICADETVHKLMRRGGKAYRPIVKTFGIDILLPDAEINRTVLGEMVFFDKALLKKLEAIVHPLVRQEMAAETKKLFRKKHPLIFWDVPLLFESGIDKLCDQTVCVSAHQKIQIARIQKRDKLNREQALARIRAQMPLRQKEKLAGFVIRNDGTRAELAKQVKKIISLLFKTH